MHLIIGGAYQGKLDYAIKTYNLTEDEIFNCTSDGAVEFKRCICHLERFALYCVQNNLEPADIFKTKESQWKTSVLICEDISTGVVPVDAVMRAWREANGRLLNWLSPRAETVTRLFCGLPQILK